MVEFQYFQVVIKSRLSKGNTINKRDVTASDYTGGVIRVQCAGRATRDHPE